MSVILVTGGSGLVGEGIKYVIENEPVGSRFGRREGEKWIFAKSTDCDLKDRAETEAYFNKERPTHVIHLAAVVGGLFVNMRQKLTFLRDNMLINENVLEACHDPKREEIPEDKRRPKVEKLISCLSTCVFPDKVTYPLTEDKVHLGPPHESNFGYAHAKRMVDVYNHAYKEQYGCNFTSAIPTNVFGPHDNFDLEDSHVIPGLMHKYYNAYTDGGDFIVAGDGSPKRQFIYSRDLAKLFIWMLREYDDVEPLILSVPAKDEISIKDVAQKIADTMQKAFHVRDGENERPAPRMQIGNGAKDDKGDKGGKGDKNANGQQSKPASNEKLRSLLGEDEFQFTPFDQALTYTVEWFVENYDGKNEGVTVRKGKGKVTA